MKFQFFEEPSPLEYPRSKSVLRFIMMAPELVDTPFQKGDVYFAPMQTKTSYGANGRKLKTARITEVPGAPPGTVGFVDWHREREVGPNFAYIDFFKVRSDWRKLGIGKTMIKEFYDRVLIPNGIDNIHWGKVVSPHAWRILQTMKLDYPKIHQAGHVDF